MIFKQVSNLQKYSSLADLRKPSIIQPPIRKTEDPFTGYFHSISEALFNQIEKIQHPYQNSFDLMFLNRNAQVDWMFSVQLILGLGDDTIFQGVLLMDRYLSVNQIPSEKMRMLAMVCLMMSSKTNQIYPVKLSKINQISKVCYSSIEYVQLQYQILNALEFKIPRGTIFQIFKVYQYKFNLNNSLKKDSIVFLLQKCLCDYELLQNDPKATAMAALNYLCRLRKLSTNNGMGDGLKDYSKCLMRISQIIRDIRVKKQSNENNPESSRCFEN